MKPNSAQRLWEKWRSNYDYFLRMAPEAKRGTAGRKAYVPWEFQLGDVFEEICGLDFYHFCEPRAELAGDFWIAHLFYDCISRSVHGSQPYEQNLLLVFQRRRQRYYTAVLVVGGVPLVQVTSKGLEGDDELDQLVARCLVQYTQGTADIYTKAHKAARNALLGKPLGSDY